PPVTSATRPAFASGRSGETNGGSIVIGGGNPTVIRAVRSIAGHRRRSAEASYDRRVIAGRFEGRMMRAAVFREVGRPLEVEEVEVAEPSAGEVLVRVAASGVCHSDYHVVAGDWSAPIPLILGHEGAGVVEAVGEGVAGVLGGDHVVL